jgi:hypothetical protein
MKKRLPMFTTPEGRAKYMAAYEAMFSLRKVSHNAIDVKTGYGFTHINIKGIALVYLLRPLSTGLPHVSEHSSFLKYAYDCPATLTAS